VPVGLSEHRMLSMHVLGTRVACVNEFKFMCATGGTSY
jgi:hypothetical protein